MRRTHFALALGLAVATAAAVVAGSGAAAHASEPLSPAAATRPTGEHLSRTVWACDRRKSVIVEGVRPDEKLPPEKARQVASLLTDLMRFCTEEIVARIQTDDEIVLSVNGMPYERYVPGGDLPHLPASFGAPTARERKIWKAELDRVVAEGDRLFHSDELGTNGLACAMCHPNAANTHPETYPKFQAQLKKVALLRDMVNWCLENPLEGKPLPDGDARLKALEAYILAQRRGHALDAGKH